MMRKRVCGNKVRVNRPLCFLVVSMLMMWLHLPESCGTPVYPTFEVVVSPNENYPVSLPALPHCMPVMFNLSITPKTGYSIVRIDTLSEVDGWNGSGGFYSYTYNPDLAEMAYRQANINGELELIDPPKGSGKVNTDMPFTVEAKGAPMKVEVGLEPLPHDIDTLAPGRICINAQAKYKKAKWKVKVKPDGTTASVTAVSGGVTVAGGAGLKDGDTFWVEGGTAVGDYELKIAHDLAPTTCTDTGGEKVFKFVYRLSSPHWENQGSGQTAYIWTDASLGAVGGSALWQSVISSMPAKSRDISGWSRGKLTTSPTPGLYSGNVSSKVKTDANQIGYLEAWGIAGVSSGGGIIAVTGTKLDWYGKLSISGGGLTTEEKDDEAFSAAAPQTVLLWRIDTDIEKEYKIDATRTFKTDVEIKTTGYVKIGGEGTGIAAGRGGGVVTTLDPGLVWTSRDELYIMGIVGPTMSNFKIVN